MKNHSEKALGRLCKVKSESMIIVRKREEHMDQLNQAQAELRRGLEQQVDKNFDRISELQQKMEETQYQYDIRQAVLEKEIKEFHHKVKV